MAQIDERAVDLAWDALPSLDKLLEYLGRTNPENRLTMALGYLREAYSRKEEVKKVVNAALVTNRLVG
jgi:hypothetical protein